MAKKKAAKKRTLKTLQILQPRQDKFLSAFAKFGNICTAAKHARVSRQSHYDWLANDRTYPARFEEAQQQANASIYEAIRKRAIDGWDEPVWHKGIQCGVVRKYSDQLLLSLGKANMPELFRENHKVDLSGDLNVNNAKQLTDEQLEAIAARCLTGASGGGSAGSPSSET